MTEYKKDVTIYLEGAYTLKHRSGLELEYVGQDIVEAITHYNLARDVAFSEEAEIGLRGLRVEMPMKRGRHEIGGIDPVSYVETWKHYDHLHVGAKGKHEVAAKGWLGGPLSCRRVTDEPFSQHRS